MWGWKELKVIYSSGKKRVSMGESWGEKDRPEN